MKLPTSLVAVKKISSSVARSSFAAEEIEKVAHSIISVEGIINPIILRRTSLESYEVVDGHFEYYAAVRAREISPLKGEMIQAIIIEPENEKVLLDQVHLLRQNSNQKPLQNHNNIDLDFRFTNLEKVFQLQFEELRKDIRNLKQEIDAVENKVQNYDFSDELIDTIVLKIIEAIRSEKKPKSKTKKQIPSEPININSATLQQLLSIPGIGDTRAKLIIASRPNSLDKLFSIVKGVSRENKESWQRSFVFD